MTSFERSSPKSSTAESVWGVEREQKVGSSGYFGPSIGEIFGKARIPTRVLRARSQSRHLASLSIPRSPNMNLPNRFSWAYQAYAGFQVPIDHGKICPPVANETNRLTGTDIPPCPRTFRESDESCGSLTHEISPIDLLGSGC